MNLRSLIILKHVDQSVRASFCKDTIYMWHLRRDCLWPISGGLFHDMNVYIGHLHNQVFLCLNVLLCTVFNTCVSLNIYSCIFQLIGKHTLYTIYVAVILVIKQICDVYVINIQFLNSSIICFHKCTHAYNMLATYT